jgi:hypothetical protein
VRYANAIKTRIQPAIPRPNEKEAQIGGENQKNTSFDPAGIRTEEKVNAAG